MLQYKCKLTDTQGTHAHFSVFAEVPASKYLITTALIRLNTRHALVHHSAEMPIPTNTTSSCATTHITNAAEEEESQHCLTAKIDLIRNKLTLD